MENWANIKLQHIKWRAYYNLYTRNACLGKIICLDILMSWRKRKLELASYGTTPFVQTSKPNSKDGHVLSKPILPRYQASLNDKGNTSTEIAI